MKIGRKLRQRESTLAQWDECGSSKRDQIFGFVCCQVVISPLWYLSSKPNFLAISSSLGLSVSMSSLSRMARVAWVSLWVV